MADTDPSEDTAGGLKKAKRRSFSEGIIYTTENAESTEKDLNKVLA
jgi:hypothetical protein